MERPIAMRLGEKFWHKNGARISVGNPFRPQRQFDEVVWHETAHIVAAGEIESATVIPSGNTLGSTRPRRMTAEAAMAAHAIGSHGTSWDRFLTRHILHADPDVAASSARAILSGKQEEMEEVAQELEDHRTIGQSHVEIAQQRARDRREGRFSTHVIIEKPDGTVRRHDVKSTHLIVMVPNEWVTLGRSTEPSLG